MLRYFIVVVIFFFGFIKAYADCITGSVLAPNIDSVSVMPSGDVIVCWPDVVDSDLDHYNIWTIDGTGANLQIGTILPTSLGSNCFIYPSASNNSGSQSVQILVESVINCPPPVLEIPSPGLVSGIGFVSTIYLEEKFNPCTSSINLKWNAYDGFPNSTIRYEVYAIVNGAPAVLDTTINSLTYDFPGVTPGNTYDFYVVAVENLGMGPFRSTSNRVNSDVTSAIISPSFNVLYTATVVDSQQIDIKFAIDTSADVTSYKIERSTSPNGPFVSVSSVNKYPNMDTLIYYSDVDVNTNNTNYFYRLEIVNDICGFSGNYSNLGSNILINVTSNSLYATNTITITDYKYWSLGVLKYDIYRAVDGIFGLTPIISLPPFVDTTTYVDDISQISKGNGEFCYKVIAVSNDALATESHSNEACALHEPLVYIPNAFSPLGTHNRDFKPVLTFSNASDYSFTVFNRWGGIVFETQNLSTAWNGKFNNSGKLCSTGVYFYIVKFNSAEGKSFEKSGSVTIFN